LLAQRGRGKGALSPFVEEIKAPDADVPEDDLADLVGEAVGWARNGQPA
jgi:hypothetical protein